MSSDYNVSYVNSTVSTIDQAILTVTGVTAQSKTYDGGTVAGLNVSNVTYTGTYGSDQVTLSGTNATGTFASADAGTNIAVTVTGTSFNLTGAQASDYTVLSASAGAANITPISLTLTAVAQTKTYDGNTSVFNTSGYTETGTLAANQSVNLTLAYTDPGAGLGNKTVTVSNATFTTSNGASVLSSDYNVSYVNSTVSTIDQAILTVTGVTAQSKTYDGGTVAGLNVSNVTYTGTYGSDQVTLSGTNATGTFASADAGTNIAVTVTGTSFNLTGAQASDYTVLSASAGAANITPISLTLTAVAQTKTYDGNTSVFNTSGYTETGTLAANQSVNLTLAYTDPGAGLGNKTVTVSNATFTTSNGASVLSSDYNVSYVNSTVSTIDQAILTVTGVTAQSKTYDGGTVAGLNVSNVTYTGTYGSDQVTLSGTNATGTFASADAGTNIAVTVTGTSFNLTGAQASDYTVLSASAGAANITPISLTLTAVAQTKRILRQHERL